MKLRLVNLLIAVIVLMASFQSCNSDGYRSVGQNSSSTQNSGLKINLLSTNKLSAGSSKLRFQIVDEGRFLTESDLLTVHEKKLHLFLFDAALKEFYHLHPESNGLDWEVTANLSVNGTYWLWIQIQRPSDAKPVEASTKISVTGGNSANQIPASLGTVLSGNDGPSVATIAPTTLSAQAEEEMEINFSRSDGSASDLSQYLGELVHAVVVPLSGSQIIHAHPKAGASATQAELHVTFPSAGDYRMWLEFIDKGVYRKVSLSVKVAAAMKEEPTPIPMPEPTPVEVSFQKDVVPILTGSKCIGCHLAKEYAPLPANNCLGWASFENRPLGSIHPATGMPTGCPDLTLYQRLKQTAWSCGASIKFVEAGDSQKSLLYRIIQGGQICPNGVAANRMPPAGSPAITAAELGVIKSWIDQGAKNN